MPAMISADTGTDVMRRFSGSWQTTWIDKVSGKFSQGGTRNIQEHSQLILDDHFLLTRELSEPDHTLSLQLMNYDRNRNAYLVRIFNSSGLLDRQWKNTWADGTSAMTGQAVDLPFGWSSRSVGHFSSEGDFIMRSWMKDETGQPQIDMEASKKRLPDLNENELAEFDRRWNEADKPADESGKAAAGTEEILSRIVGDWNRTPHSGESESPAHRVPPAGDQPAGDQPAGVVSRRFILNRQMVMETLKPSEGPEELSLIAFHPEFRFWQRWSFNSEGKGSRADGEWDETTQSMNFEVRSDDGTEERYGFRLISSDTIEWTFSAPAGHPIPAANAQTVRTGAVDHRQPISDSAQRQQQ